MTKAIATPVIEQKIVVTMGRDKAVTALMANIIIACNASAAHVVDSVKSATSVNKLLEQAAEMMSKQVSSLQITLAQKLFTIHATYSPDFEAIKGMPEVHKASLIDAGELSASEVSDVVTQLAKACTNNLYNLNATIKAKLLGSEPIEVKAATDTKGAVESPANKLKVSAVKAHVRQINEAFKLADLDVKTREKVEQAAEDKAEKQKKDRDETIRVNAYAIAGCEANRVEFAAFCFKTHGLVVSFTKSKSAPTK